MRASRMRPLGCIFAPSPVKNRWVAHVFEPIFSKKHHDDRPPDRTKRPKPISSRRRKPTCSYPHSRRHAKYRRTNTNTLTKTFMASECRSMNHDFRRSKPHSQGTDLFGKRKGFGMMHGVVFLYHRYSSSKCARRKRSSWGMMIKRYMTEKTTRKANTHRHPTIRAHANPISPFAA